MYCKNCGKIIDDDSQFCTHCGSPTQKSAAVSAPSSQEDIRPKGRTSSLAIAGIICAVLVLLGSSAFVAYRLTSRTDSSSPSSATSLADSGTGDVENIADSSQAPSDSRGDREAIDIAPEADTALASASMDAYRAFLNDEIPAVYKGANEKLTLMETANGINQRFLSDWGYSDGGDLLDITYTYIDCGNDGINELAVSYNADNTYAGSLVYIYGWDGNDLRELNSYAYAYRVYGALGKYGTLSDGGSGGASTGGMDFYVFTPDGKKHFIYSYTYQFSAEYWAGETGYTSGKSARDHAALGNAVLSSGREDGSVMFEEYRFDSFDMDTEDFDAYYELPRYYSADGDDMDFVRKCFDEAGIRFYTEEEIGSMIEDRYGEYGLTIEMANDMAEWETLTSSLNLPLTEGIYGRYEYKDSEKGLTYKAAISKGYSSDGSDDTVDPDLQLEILKDGERFGDYYNLRLEMQEEKSGIIYSTDSDLEGGANFSSDFKNLDITFSLYSGSELSGTSLSLKKVK